MDFTYPDGIEPRYIVVRAHPDLPPGFLPPHLEGRWFDRGTPPSITPPMMPNETRAVAMAVNRYEVRDSDGATAQVYEVAP